MNVGSSGVTYLAVARYPTQFQVLGLDSTSKHGNTLNELMRA